MVAFYSFVLRACFPLQTGILLSKPNDDKAMGSQVKYLIITLKTFLYTHRFSVCCHTSGLSTLSTAKQDFNGNELTSFNPSLLCLLQLTGMPPIPTMPMPPMPPGMGMLQAMSMMPGGPPPPGIHMSMEHPGLPPPGLTQEDQLKMVQQRAAMVLQQEERAKQQVRWLD